MSIYDDETTELLRELAADELDEGKAVTRYTFGLVGALVVALAAPEPFSKVAFVLAALCALIAVGALMAQTRVEGQIFVVKNLHRFRTEVSGADWLAYHLAERVREEQAAIEAAEVAREADDAIAALHAWIAANPAPVAREENEPVH